MKTRAYVLPALIATMITLAGIAAPAAFADTAEQFGDGVFVVGTQIAPGTYSTVGPAKDKHCYYATYKTDAGDVNDVATMRENDYFDSHRTMYVDVETDKRVYFSLGCRWTMDARNS